MAREATKMDSLDAIELSSMTSATLVTSLEERNAASLTMQQETMTEPGTAAAIDKCSDPTDNGAPPLSPDNGAPPPSPPPSPPPPPPQDDPLPTTNASYVNVSSSNTKRRVVESYEYVNGQRLVHPSSNYAQSLAGPGYGVVGNSKMLASGDGYTYVSNREASLLDRGKEECPQCQQYQQQLDQWQHNSVTLTSSFSKILAQLNMAQTLLMRLEDTIKDELACRIPSPTNLVPPDLDLQRVPTGVPRIAKRSHTMMLGSTGSLNNISGPTSPDKTVVTDMYPDGEDTYNMSPECHKQLRSLASHLGKAIDLCQSSAAALFKRGQLTPPRHKATSSSVHSPSSRRHKPPLVRLSTQPAYLDVRASKGHLSDYASPLTSVKESSLMMDAAEGSAVHSLDNESGANRPKDGSASNEVSGFNSDAKSSTEEKVRDNGGAEVGGVGGNKHWDVGGGNDKEVGVAPHKDGSADKDGDGRGVGQSRTSAGLPDPDMACNHQQPQPKEPYVSHMMALMMKEEHGFCIVDYPHADKEITADTEEENHIPDRTADDKDFKQAMSKIADMEEERRNLLEEIETLQQDNLQVRFSLTDALNALENKELQLLLVMQDLVIATQEIKRAAEMRAELAKLKMNRDQILEKFRALEDDHAAVKYSLLQQLRQRPNNRAEMEEEKGTIYKQGFLVKQGGLVKSWKRRLFVLDNEGLSYYKAEQPVQVVTLNKISKVEHTRDATAQHKFEVYTSERVFRLLAPSHKEMQSWVGILQTLKDHRRTVALARDGKSKTNLGVSPTLPSKLSKLASQDSHDSDVDITSPKAATLPTTTSKNEEQLPSSLPQKSVLSFQQLKTEDERDEDPVPKMSFSLPVSHPILDELGTNGVLY